MNNFEGTEHWLIDFCRKLRHNSFYGRITLEFKRGEIVLLRREETVKPPQQLGSTA